MAAPEILLTEEQRLEFTQVSPDISELKIAKYYTFTDYDHEIINRHRRDYNKLGFAVQLAMMRYPGWTFLNVDSVPPRVLSYISDQVDALPEEIVQYAQRDNTRLEHLQEIREVYGFTNFTDAELDNIKNVSSLNWEHINFIGDYCFDSKTTLDPDKLRPLNIEKF